MKKIEKGTCFVRALRTNEHGPQHKKEGNSMKKQLLAITLIALGYVASSHGGGVLLTAYVTKLKTEMKAGGYQNVWARSIALDENNPTVPGQQVLEIEEIEAPTKKGGQGTWRINALNPGTATVYIKKRNPGYSHEHEKGLYHCTPTTITVIGKKTGKRGIMDDNTNKKMKNNKKNRKKSMNDSMDE